MVAILLIAHVHFVAPLLQKVNYHLKPEVTRDEAKARAHAWTWHADMENVESALEAVIPNLCGGPLVIIGISNGCILAVEMARRIKTQALWLASGVPAQAAACCHAGVCGKAYLQIPNHNCESGCLRVCAHACAYICARVCAYMLWVQPGCVQSPNTDLDVARAHMDKSGNVRWDLSAKQYAVSQIPCVCCWRPPEMFSQRNHWMYLSLSVLAGERDTGAVSGMYFGQSATC